MFIYFIPFTLGCCIGSFISLSLDRYYTTDSLLSPRSYCLSCQKTLSYWQLIPLLSYLLLKGRCYYCNYPFSNSSFYIELLTGNLFALLFYLIRLTPSNLPIVLLIFSSFWLTFFDLYFFIVEPTILFISTILSLILQSYLNGFYSIPIIDFFILFLFFYLYNHYFPSKIGQGDIKLLLSWSLILSNYLLLVTILLASVLAIMTFYFLPNRKTQQGLPFVPFLFVALLTNYLLLQ